MVDSLGRIDYEDDDDPSTSSGTASILLWLPLFLELGSLGFGGTLPVHYVALMPGWLAGAFLLWDA